MKVKKSLVNRIHGWLPKNPLLLPAKANSAGQKTGKRFFFAQSPLGLKLVATLFWFFGVLACLMVVSQFRVFAHLPFNVRLVIISVTLLDAAAMFIVGAGVLTVKKRWINVAILFSVFSIVVFYVIPLRAALPLELIPILYLLTMRKDLAPKRFTPKAVIAASIALAVLTCSSMFVPVYAQSADPINSEKTIVYSSCQSSGNYGVKVTVYQISDADDTHDYYFLEINLNASKVGFNCAKVNASFTSEVTVFPSWVPHSNPAQFTALSLGVATIYLGNVDKVLVYANQQNGGGICWVENALNVKEKGTFSAELIVVNQDAHFTLNLTTEAGLNSDVFGTLWLDNQCMEGISV